MIETPDVPVAQPEQEWSPERGTQTLRMLATTLAQIREFSQEVESEISSPRVTIMPTNRVLLSSDDTDLIAYMSDPAADARLVLDDYFPEDEADAQGS